MAVDSPERSDTVEKQHAKSENDISDDGDDIRPVSPESDLEHTSTRAFNENQVQTTVPSKTQSHTRTGKHRVDILKPIAEFHNETDSNTICCQPLYERSVTISVCDSHEPNMSLCHYAVCKRMTLSRVVLINRNADSSENWGQPCAPLLPSLSMFCLEVVEVKRSTTKFRRNLRIEILRDDKEEDSGKICLIDTREERKMKSFEAASLEKVFCEVDGSSTAHQQLVATNSEFTPHNDSKESHRTSSNYSIASPSRFLNETFWNSHEEHVQKVQRSSERNDVGSMMMSKSGLINMILIDSWCCVLAATSDGSVNIGHFIMIFIFVIGYYIVVRKIIFGAKKLVFGQNVSLIFGIFKSLEVGKRCEEINSFDDEELRTLSTKRSSFAEKPLVYLGAPGPRTYENQISREDTFRNVHNLTIPAALLAQHGFFWNGQQAQCYSCNSSHELSGISQCPESNFWHAPSCHLLHSHGSYRSRLRQVASDTPGRISDDIRDPPGQRSIYIPPGDQRVESYRLSTFNNYPVHSPIDRKALAKGGFYFTGYSDRVKCFACGRTVERWETSDNPLDLKWHKDSCPHPRGGACGNVPSANLFTRLQGSTGGFNQRNTNMEVLEQRDPRTGEFIRTVRYPADLPERVRRSGGTFDIGPNNSVNIQRGGISQNPGVGEPRVRINTTPSVVHQPPRQWRMANVVSSDHRRFLNNLYFNRELDRLVSFARWPTGRPTVSPTDLSRNGFFYLGDMDRTQCFSCAGVLRNWTVNDSARVEHRTHFPNCPFVLGTETRNVPIPTQPETAQERQRKFPCRFPSNPHMRSEATRLDTFDSRWPVGRMAATAEEIARAGFFFLGERDRVKCWYCNGGLQHWDYDDAPWVEHAKWFPNCQFLLSVKGQHFVYRHLTTSAHLSRPIIARQEGATVDPSEQGSGEPPEDIPPSQGNVRGPTPPPTIVDPREEMRKKKEHVEKVLKESDIVKNVLAMGFSIDLVRAALQEKVDVGEEANSSDIYGTVSSLLEVVMQKESEEEQRLQNEAALRPGPSTSMMPSVSSVYSSMTTDPHTSSLGPSPGSGKYNVSFMDEDDDRDMYGAEPMSEPGSMNSVTRAKQHDENPASLQEALNRIEEERMCKICFSNQADMVFVPCGHMCCCMNCTEAIRHCPVCRVRIEKAIKTYLE